MPDLQDQLDRFTQVGGWVIVAQLLLIVILTLIALRFARSTVNAALGRLIEREARDGTAQQLGPEEVERRRRTLQDLGYQSARVLILVIAFLMALNVLHFDIGPAIAGIGVAGLAVSLGAQNLVRDYVAGAFVLIENQYSVGDVVSVAGVTGTVEDINLRRTTVRSIDGTLHFVPHGLIEVTSNLTRIWARVSFDIPIGYDTDVERLAAIVNQAGRELASDPAWAGRVLEPPTFLRVGNLGEYGTAAKVLGTVSAGDRWEATGEMRRRIVEGAAREGVRIGWPAETSDTLASQTNPQLPGPRQR